MPLNIDFDQYTNGDAGFERELVLLMITDIQEFQQSLANAVLLKDPVLFLKGCHKANTSLCMVNDHDFMDLLDELKSLLVEDKINSRQMLAEKTLLFNKRCKDLCKGLAELHH